MTVQTTNIEKLSPIWPVADIAATEAFYRQLGFHTVYKDLGEAGAGGGYLILKREMAEIHGYGQAGHMPAASTHGAYMRPRDIDAISEEWRALGLPSEGIPRFVPAEDKPWGMRELALVDIDGHLIRAGLEIPGWNAPPSDTPGQAEGGAP